jgi:hypothetical protein
VAQRLAGVFRILKTPASEIATASALARKFSKNLPDESVHVLCGGWVLRKDQVSFVGGRQQRDRFVCFRDFCREEAQKRRLRVIKQPLNDESTLGVRFHFAHRLSCFQFR